jgi:glycosidase
MLQFSLPGNYPCIYQGQEIGTKNPQLSNDINDYPGVQSRMIYRRQRKEGKTKRQAMKIVKQMSRDNARQPIDWAEYIMQDHNPQSTLNFYRYMIHLWREDPVLIHGNLKVKKTSRKGIFEFYRVYKKQKYFVHLDMTNRTISYIRNQNGEIIASSR